MKKTTLFCLVTIFTLMIALAGCGPSESKDAALSASNDDTILIGSIWDVTGNGSSIGVPERNALQLLVEETNANGGINGKMIKLIEADNQSDETKALTEAKRILNQENVLAIVGGVQSTTSLAMIPTIEEEGVPYISNGSVQSIIEGRHWTFRTPPPDSLLTATVLEDMQEKGYKKLAILRVNNDYGKAGETAFKSNAPEFGVEVTGVEQFNADDKDVKIELSKLMETNPDALVVWALAPGAAVATKGYYELGYTDKAQLYVSSANASPTYIELAGPGSAGVLMPSYKYQIIDQLSEDDPQYEIITTFKEKYEEKYGVSQYAVSNAADAWYLLEDAIRRAGDNVTRETIRDNLESTEGLMGQIGEYNMSPDNHNGLDSSGLVIIKVENEGFILEQ